MSTSNPKTLHALLVAIDKYPIPRHQLNGCVNDRNAFKTYVENSFGETDIELNIKTLTDEEVTKKALIESFDHFSSAKDGDICLFYFSGHGSQSPAPSAFWHLAPNRMNESLVCYDSRIKGGKDLMDKELAYLFWKASRDKDLHFLSVFDCCHSGAITRDVGVTSRMAEAASVPSKLEDYHGYEHYKKTEVDGTLQVSPPLGNIIQLGAAKSYETAKELRIGTTTRGIFTYSLIETLEQSGEQMTYADLMHTLKMKIGNKVRKQTPMLIAEPSEKRMRFLSANTKASQPYYLVNFDKGEWKLNAGRVQGIPEQGGSLKTSEGTELTITNVGPNYSVVSGMEGKETNRSYMAFIKEIEFQELKVAYAPGIDEAGKGLLQQLFDSFTFLIKLVDDPAVAQYWMYADTEAFYLTLPNEEMPVFRRIDNYTLEGAEAFINDISVVAKWVNLLDLRNPKTTIQDSEVKIELLRITEPGNEEDNAPTEVVDWREESNFIYRKSDGAWKEPGFQFKITNTGFRKLFVSTLNMEANFKISNKMMAMEEIAPGETVWLLDNFQGNTYRTIPLRVDDAYHSWNVTEAKEYMKVFISTDPNLDTNQYNQEGLEFDVRNVTAKRAGRSSRANPNIPDWKTVEIPLVIVRPMEEQVVTGGKPANLVENCELLLPAGVSATVKLSNLSDAERAVAGNGRAEAAVRALGGSLFSAGEIGVAEPLMMTRGTNDSPGLSVLELSGMEGADQVDAEHPLYVNTRQELGEHETIIPIGFDEETGLLYPIGFADAAGKVTVETLPDPSETGERGLLGSVKIFFQKVVLKKIGLYQHPQIAIPEFEAEGEEFVYNTDATVITEKVQTAQKIAIVIHGIIGDTKEMAKSLRRAKLDDERYLEEHFDLVLTFDYENLNTPIDETSRLMKAKLESIGLGADHGKELTVIAHSMGGLVTRWFIEKEGGDQVVSHLIQLGTPNLGSPWSSVYEMASMFLGRAINGASFLQPYLVSLSFIGKYVNQLFITLKMMHEEDSDFIKNLNDGTTTGTRISIIAGNTQLIPVKEQAAQASLLKKLWKRFKSRGHYDALDLFLFKEPNDIAVRVTSIKGVPIEDSNKVEVPCDHLGYFGTPESLEALKGAVLSTQEVS